MSVNIELIKEFNPTLVKELFLRVGEENILPNRAFFENKQNILLVAHDGSETCGFLYAYFLDNLKQKSTKIFLYSIDVFEPYRQKGIGTQLVEALKKIAKDNSCIEIFVITNNRNTAALNLYKKTGGSFNEIDDVVFVYEQ